MNSEKENFKENTEHRNPIEFIEKELNISFPIKFKDFFAGNLPNENIRRIELLDGSYKFLDSLFDKQIKDIDENVIAVSRDLNSSYYPEDKEYVKIPFAKSTEGDGFKYLYFIAKTNNEAKEKIFLRDKDSPATGRIPLSNKLALIFGKTRLENGELIIDNTALNFSEASSLIEIPEFINIEKNSYGTDIRNEKNEDKFKMDLYLKNCKSIENEDENFSIIEVQVDMIYQGKRMLSAMRFEIDKPGLLIQFWNNVNYRIFYHKLVCVIKTMATMADDLKENNNLEIVEFLNKINLQELAQQDFIQMEEQEY